MTTLSNLAQRLNFHPPEMRLPRLILVTDRDRLPDPVTALAALRPGDAVLVRDYDAADRAALAHRLRGATTERRLRLLVAGDLELAATVKADGIHLPEWAVGPLGGGARRWRAAGPDRLLTTAAHGPDGLWRSHRLDADAALLAPVFATTSHPGSDVIGPLRFAAWSRRAPLPVYALGGITAATARRLAAAHLAGYAAVSAFGDEAAPPPGTGRGRVWP